MSGKRIGIWRYNILIDRGKMCVGRVGGEGGIYEYLVDASAE